MSKAIEDSRRVADHNFRRYVRARDAGHLDWVEIARKCDDFYRGEQWDQADKDKLDAQGRPTLTINTVLTTVNTVLGEQSRTRGEIVFKPRRDATQDVADTLTKLAMQISDDNQLDWAESQVFADGLIQDRGFYEIRMNFDDKVEGEIEIIALDPLDVVLDPDAKEYDPKTWNEVTISRWLSLDEVELTYGKKAARDLRNVAATRSEFGDDSILFGEQNFGTPGDFETDSDSGDERTIRNVRIIERQSRKIKIVEYLVDPETSYERRAPDGADPKRLKLFADTNGLLIKRKPEKKVRWTVSCDHILLHDDWSIYDDFTIIPYFPFFRRGKPFGMVRNLLSPQEQLNKVSSQELHIVNTTSNSGYDVEQGSLTNMTVEELEQRGAETGLVIEYAKSSTPPLKRQPNQIPTGLDRISMKAANNIKEISGISDAMLGQESAEVSGVALQAKTQRGAVQIQTPLDNLARTRHILARRMHSLIKNFYTEHRVIQITQGNMARPEEKGEMIGINVPDPLTGEVRNNVTVGEYDVVISTQPARDTFDESQFAEALNLRNVGVAVPDDAVIEYSHLSRKRELAERVREMTGQGTPSEEQQQLAQQMQQIQMRQVELEIANSEADLENKKAQALLSTAKAQDFTSDGDDINLEIRKLEQDLLNKREERANKVKLAHIHGETNLRKAQHDSQTKIALESLKPKPNTITH